MTTVVVRSAAVHYCLTTNTHKLHPYLWLWFVVWATAISCSNDSSTPGAQGAARTASGTASGTGNDPAPARTVRVTGIPDENPTELQRSYAPLVDLLERELGVPVQYIPVTDYGAAVQALVAGKVDFAWLGGFTHVQARNMTEVVPLAMRDIDREFRSVFVAHADSGIDKPEQLRGKRFAFGSKSSTSGHLMPRHFLRDRFAIDPDRDFAGAPVFSNAHDATVKMVESGRVDAGAINIQVWERLVKAGAVDTNRVRVIWKTPPFADYVWTGRAAVDAELRAKFTQAFLSLRADNPEHQPILERLGATKYVPARASDFDPVEAVGRQVGLIK